MATLVNIGCGTICHPDWINLDLLARLPGVRACDLRQGLPFADGTVDVCYSSHLLEHLRPIEVAHLLAEQRRVLRPGGIVRVVVPDLELICREYLAALDAVRRGESGGSFRHEDSRLTLIDQLVRERGGGDLAALWRSSAVGDEERAWLETRHGREVGAVVDGTGTTSRPMLGGFLRRWRRRATGLAVLLLGGREDLRALRDGRFRNAGEIHRTMFDDQTLTSLLEDHDFVDVRHHTALTSDIDGFARFGLDAVDGRSGKPDSLYLEARTPEPRQNANTMVR